MARARTGGLVAKAATSLFLLATLVSCTSTARIVDVYTALDANGDRQRNVFFTDTKEIHCVVEVGIGRKGVTIEVLIRGLQVYDFVDNNFKDESYIAANAETSPQPSTGIQKVDTSFKPAGEDGNATDGVPFPRGRYQCEAYLDGKLEEISIFNIDFPPCPTTIIRPGSVCFGFYPEATACPRNGATSTDTTPCVCSAKKGWECAR